METSELLKDLQVLFKDMELGAYIQSADGCVIDVNSAALTILGMTREQFLASPCAGPGRRFLSESGSELPPDLQPAAVALRTMEPVRDFVAGQHAEGGQEPVWVNINAVPLPGEPGSAPSRVLVTLKDISRQKRLERVEAELLEARELFTLFMKYSPIYTFIKQLEGDTSRVLLLSDNFINMVGRPAEELRGRTMDEMFPADFARKITGDDIAVVRGGKVVQLDEELNGLKYATIKFPIPREGRDSLLAGFTIDVTDQRRAEEAVRQQARLLDIAHDSISVRDMDDRITYWNHGAVRLYGFAKEEVQGRMIHEVLQTVSPKPLKEIHEQLQRDNLWEGELQHTARDGSAITVASRWVLQRGEAGEPVAVLEINNDITQTKNAEKERDNLQLQMFHAQKLESLGVLAGGIAHDFNNILTTIMGNTELALMQLAPGTPVCDNLHRVEKASRRAADLVKQMLAYSGKGRFHVELVDVNKLVEEMVQMLEAAISKKATLRLELARPLRFIRADAVQMRQIIMNLVLNASEALGDEVGKIKLSTAQEYYSEDQLKGVWFGGGLGAGFYLTLAVSDTGCGIDKETQSKIFDPFFSTKFAGRGLGMSAVLGIVRSHKGGIKLQSDLGMGSTFTVILPANDDILTTSKPLEPPHEPVGSGPVLLVDDEEEVCEMVGQMLTKLGYEVITARDGREALEAYLQRDDFALVILDLTMPVMDGEQTYKQLQGIDPSVKVIITSGYSEKEVAKRFDGKGVKGVLQKPFDMAALRRVIG